MTITRRGFVAGAAGLALAGCGKNAGSPPFTLAMMPKSLLRSRDSKLDDFISGSLQLVIDDPTIISRDQVRRVLLCSGKVYYTLNAAREKNNVRDVAIGHILAAEKGRVGERYILGNAEGNWTMKEAFAVLDSSNHGRRAHAQRGGQVLRGSRWRA